MSSAVHIGNLDVVGEFVYDYSEQLVDRVSKVKEYEEIYLVMNLIEKY
jgi:hypothetical protein